MDPVFCYTMIFVLGLCTARLVNAVHNGKKSNKFTENRTMAI